MITCVYRVYDNVYVYIYVCVCACVVCACVMFVVAVVHKIDLHVTMHYIIFRE
jgi:hypothetical protein